MVERPPVGDELKGITPNIQPPSEAAVDRCDHEAARLWGKALDEGVDRRGGLARVDGREGEPCCSADVGDLNPASDECLPQLRRDVIWGCDLSRASA
jgi:hypothetical protein